MTGIEICVVEEIDENLTLSNLIKYLQQLIDDGTLTEDANVLNMDSHAISLININKTKNYIQI